MCGHHTLFFPESLNFPLSAVVGQVGGRNVGCCNPLCSSNDDGDEDDYEDDDDD